MSELTEKSCFQCKEILSIDNFYPTKHIKCGYESTCKGCRKGKTSDTFNTEWLSRAILC